MIRTAQEQYDIFLSNSPSDSALADAVRQRLSESGVRCFSLEADLTAGDDIATKIRTALKVSRAYVAILSKAFATSPNFLVEAGAAWAADLPVFLLLNDVKRTEVPVFLDRYQFFYLWQGLPKLVAAIRKLPERVPA